LALKNTNSYGKNILITLIPYCSNATFIDFELSFNLNLKVQKPLVEDLDSQALVPVANWYL